MDTPERFTNESDTVSERTPDQRHGRVSLQRQSRRVLSAARQGSAVGLLGSMKIVLAACRIWSEAFVEQVGGCRRRLPGQGGHMAEYLIYFNQQWVGDHSEEWFRERGPLAMAVVNEMKDAGVYVFAGGLEEETEEAFSADATSGTLTFTDGPYVETKEYLGGLTVVDVADEDAARMWAGKIAEACGWPQEVRRFKPQPGTS
jgi:hypothetical protein